MAKRFASDTGGTTATEYGVIAALIGVTIIVAITTFDPGLEHFSAWIRGVTGT